MTEELRTFIATIVRSQLLDQRQLDMAVELLPAESRTADQLAKFLVDTEKLTPFQAEKLQRGTSQGLVLGPYQVLAPIGKGGMGAVYLALDTRSNIHVALKVLIPKKAREKQRLLARFEREKDLSQRVCHPHVAITFDAGAFQNIHYIAMEFIPGQTLYRMVMKSGVLPVGRAARLFAEIADGLEHAHAQGLIHRDIKPSNIMITPNDHAKLLDLGLAFMRGEEVHDIEVQGGKGYLVGSIDYMAPEQTVDASQVDGRSDVYALGCCLYFAMTGKPVFSGKTFKEKLQAQRKLEPEPLEERNMAIPVRFAAVVHKMLAKDPAHRFQTCRELAHELRLWSDANLGTPPIETQGDESYLEAVHKLSTATFAVVKDDELFANFEPIDPETPTEPKRAFFEEGKNLILLLIIALTLAICVSFGCIVAIAIWVISMFAA